MFRWRIATFCVLAAVVFLATSCSEDDGPTTPDGDTTAPLIVSIDPSTDDTGVATDAVIAVTFNEAMDPTTATGNVSLTAGTITALDWSTDRVLEISHSTWSEGAEIQVNVTTGLTDVAGNALAQSGNTRFWTVSSVLQLLTTEPQDGTTDVIRNGQVRMLFSAEMNLASLQSAISVNSPGTAKLPITFEVNEAGDDWVAMSFVEMLPASTQITVDISTAASSTQGGQLGDAVSFAFTTGTGTDDTPPDIAAITPVNGSTISPDTPSIQMTFTEPMDPNSIEPSRIGAQFWLLLESVGFEPQWSQNNTVVTVPLPTPLPAGLPVVVTFSGIADAAGNVQETPIEYRVDVAGIADPWPQLDGARYIYLSSWVNGDETGPVADGTGETFVQVEQQNTDTFHWVEYQSGQFRVNDDWDVYRRTGNAVQLIGFHNANEGGVSDIAITPPVEIARYPWQTQVWDGTAVASEPEGDLDVIWSVQVSGPEDLPAIVFPESEMEIVWIDCWQATLTFALSMMGEPIESGSETSWYAPAVGPVRNVEQGEQPNGSWYEHTEDLVSFSFVRE